ncbi:hypothetical protein COU18_02465, partial [Candidatus Kaiserbacteria bacterium CG10_big_fil_rev_8_21_14_0_10_51_14]
TSIFYSGTGEDTISLPTAPKIGESKESSFIVSGLIDDARVYNRALSENEITALYNSGAAKLSSSRALTAGSTLEDGLISHWTFDGKDMTSNVADVSGSGNDARLVNSAATTTAIGKLGQALRFDGVAEHVRKDSFTGESGTAGSVAFWGYFDDINSSDGIFTTNGLVPLMWVSGSNIRTYLYDSDLLKAVDFSTALPTDQWVHFSLTWDADAATMYKNGVQVLQDTSATSSYNAAGSVFLMTDRVIADRYTAGKMDDVRVYNRALSVDEVTQLYNLGEAKANASSKTLVGASSLSSGLVGHWTFDGNDMTSNVADVSGNGHNGILSGFTSTTTAIGKFGQALQFGGDDEYVSMGDVDDLDELTQLSFSLWVNRSSAADAWSAFISKMSNSSNGWGIQRNGSGDGLFLSFRNSDSSNGNTTTGLPLDAWTAVTVVYDGSGSTNADKLKLYINGVNTSLSYTGTIPSSLPATTGSLNIGKHQFESLYFGGQIDDVHVYNRALSASEVKQLYLIGQ